MMQTRADKVRSTLRALALATCAFAYMLEVSQALADHSGEEVEPLRCWWRTDRSAVRVGEHFEVVLTCAAAQTDTAATVPEWEQLQPGVIDLAPYEVVAGERYEDVVTGMWRYTQLTYSARLTGEEFFGQDIPLPSLEVPFSIEVVQPGGGTQRGRERTYVLPPLPMKVLSLVSAQTSDIQEIPTPSFAAIERRRVHARLALLAGIGASIAGAAYALWFAASLLRRSGARRKAPRFELPLWYLIASCRRRLARVSDDARRAGWNEASIGEALAILRLLGAIALRRPIRQQLLSGDYLAESGELIVRRPALRSKVILAASVTDAQLREAADRAPPDARVGAGTLAALASAVASFSHARYARDEQSFAGAEELHRAIDGARRVAREIFLSVLVPAPFGKRVAARATVLAS